MGGNPGSQPQFSTAPTPGLLVNHVNHRLGKDHKDILFATNAMICALLVFLFHFHRLSRVINLKQKNKTTKRHTQSYKSQTRKTVSTYHKPRLQQCIQRMQPTKGTHHWLHNSQRAETHTCHPEEREKNKAEFISGPTKRGKTEVEEGI